MDEPDLNYDRGIDPVIPGQVDETTRNYFDEDELFPWMVCAGILLFIIILILSICLIWCHYTQQKLGTVQKYDCKYDQKWPSSKLESGRCLKLAVKFPFILARSGPQFNDCEWSLQTVCFQMCNGLDLVRSLFRINKINNGRFVLEMTGHISLKVKASKT